MCLSGRGLAAAGGIGSDCQTDSPDLETTARGCCCGVLIVDGSNIYLDDKARENGAFGFKITFKDTDGSIVTPDSVTYSLYGKTELVVNGKEDVVAAPLASTMTFRFQGSDLLLSDTSKRYCVIKYQYDSTELGDDTEDCIQVEFDIASVAGQ